MLRELRWEMSRVAEPVIENLWIIEKNSGVLLFEENYKDFTKEEISVDLVTSFLSAILNFIDEAFTDEIQFIQFSSRKILFQFTEYVLFVVIVNNNEYSDGAKVKQVINEISARFYENYQHIFEGQRFDGRIARFRIFSDDLRKIVKGVPLSIRLLKLEKIKRNKRQRDERRKRRKEESLK